MTLSQTPRGSLSWLGALLAGGMSAAAFGFAFLHAETLLVFMSYLAPLPLFTAGLGAGFLPGVLAGLSGTAALYLKLSPEMALSFFLLNALPVIVIGGLALRYRTGGDGKIYWYPEGSLLTAITLYPCLIFLGALGLAWNMEGGLLGVTSAIAQEVLGPLTEQVQPDQAETFKLMVAFLPRVLPALLGCSWLFLMLMNGLAAQSILKQQKWNLRATFAWRGIETPTWLLLAAAATGLSGAFGPAPFDYIGSNLCFILCMPFFIVGLAVIHAAADSYKFGLFFLIPFYVLLVALSWLAVLVALIGAMDQGLHFRQRLARRPQRSDQQGENDD